MPPAQTWLKMTAVGLGLCVGGPLFVQSIRPSDQELFERFSPDIQQKSLEEGPRRAREFDEYVNRLKEWSRSDKSIWIAAQEQAEQKKEAAQAQRRDSSRSAESGSGSGKEDGAQKEEMRRELLGEK